MRALAICGLASLLLGQEPVIRVNTRLIQVNVVVHDKNGPVADLTKNDFTILDKGRPQRIGVFNVYKTAAAAAPARQLPTGLFTNRLDLRPDHPSSVTVLLLDVMNTAFDDQTYVRDQALKFLSTLRRGDRVALYLLTTRGVQVIHDFTGDAAAVADDVARMQGQKSVAERATSAPPPANVPASGAAGGVMARLSALLAQNIQDMNRHYSVDRARLTAQAMIAIGRHLGRVPGRKNLVWVSGSFPIMPGWRGDGASDSIRVQSYVKDAVRALSSADVAVYPVDARGLIAMRGAAGSMRMARASAITNNQDTMRTFADATGGRAYSNTNGIAEAMRKAMDDAAVTYTLGFYADAEKFDGSFHDLKVRVDRSGLDVRYRSGYFAMDPPAPSDQERSALERREADSPLESTGIGLTAAIVRAGRSFRLDVTMDVSDLKLKQADNRWTGNAEITYFRQAADGRRLGLTSRIINFNVNDEVYRKTLKEGLVLGEIIEPVKDLDHIRIVAIDQDSGAVGSLIVQAPKS
jgi:VWFA-related protein